MLGTFLTQQPFPIDLAGAATFRELLARVRQTALGVYAHQELPFGKLVEAMQPARDTSRPPVIQTLVQVLDGAPAAVESRRRLFEAVDAYDGNARYELMLTLFDAADGLGGSLEYDADLFDPATAERLCELFLLQAAAVTADPDLPLAALPVLTAAARHQAVVEWNDTARPLAGVDRAGALRSPGRADAGRSRPRRRRRDAHLRRAGPARRPAGPAAARRRAWGRSRGWPCSSTARRTCRSPCWRSGRPGAPACRSIPPRRSSGGTPCSPTREPALVIHRGLARICRRCRRWISRRPLPCRTMPGRLHRRRVPRIWPT